MKSIFKENQWAWKKILWEVKCCNQFIIIKLIIRIKDRKLDWIFERKWILFVNWKKRIITIIIIRTLTSSVFINWSFDAKY